MIEEITTHFLPTFMPEEPEIFTFLLFVVVKTYHEFCRRAIKIVNTNITKSIYNY